MTVTEVFSRITTALERAGMEYMLVGSFASTRYSSPRSTQNIDIVISATPEQLRIFIEDLIAKNWYAEIEAALEAHRNESLFNIIELNTGWKIDLIFRKSTAFGQEEFRRRRKVELHGLQYLWLVPRTSLSRNSSGQRSVAPTASLKISRLSCGYKAKHWTWATCANGSRNCGLPWSGTALSSCRFRLGQF